MKKLDLVQQTITDALGYTIKDAKIEGYVVDIKTNEGEAFSLLIFLRPMIQTNEPYFSVSHEGLAFAEGCKCRYIANVYGKNKVCSIVAVDAPYIVSYDEWGDKIHTYKNPLHNE